MPEFSNVEKLTQDQLSAYLKRIGYKDTPKLDLATFTKIHELHALNVPFEALDVHIGARANDDKSPVDLTLNAVFDKIVTRNRGGYCYETNKLLAAVLATIGFNVYSNKAGVILYYPTKRPPGHRMLTVELNGKIYVADVGFGGPGQIAPLELVLNKDQQQGQHVYRFILDDTNEYELQKKSHKGYDRLYAFNPQISYDEKDYESHNLSTSTSPESLFVKKMICTRPLPNGRITLVDNMMKVADLEKNTEDNIELTTMQEYLTALEQYFAIKLPFNVSLDRQGKQILFKSPSQLLLYADVILEKAGAVNDPQIKTQNKGDLRLRYRN